MTAPYSPHQYQSGLVPTDGAGSIRDSAASPDFAESAAAVTASIADGDGNGVLNVPNTSDAGTHAAAPGGVIGGKNNDGTYIGS